MPSNISKTLYSIIARPSLFRGEGGVVGDYSEFAENLSLSVAYDGPNEFSFDITTNTKSLGELARLFNNILGRDISIDTGNRIWRGYIDRLILSSGKTTRQRAVDTIVNEVDISHTGGVMMGYTIPSLSTESQLRFGRRVFRQTESEDLILADAQLQAEYLIRTRAFSRIEPLSRSASTGLRVHGIGYLSVLEWCTTTLVGGETMQQAFERIITDCGQSIVTFGTDTIMDNGQTWQTSSEGTGLELIRKLENVPDTSGNLWRFYIDTENVAHWEPINMTPAYEIRQGISEASSGIFKAYYGGRKIEPFDAKAGVIIRDSTFSIEREWPGSPFQSVQDSYVKIVKFDALGNPSFEKGDLIDFGATGTYGT